MGNARAAAWPGHGCELYPSKIREALDAEDWEDAEHNVDSYGQERRLYLGSIFSCTPSGKFYAPFARSNVLDCDTCKGVGSILTVKRRVAKRRAVKRMKDRARYMKAGPLYVHRDLRDAKHAAVMRRYHLDNASKRSCTACGGMGSREAYLDECWREYAEALCESVGASLENGEGDPCDLFIVEYRDTTGEEVKHEST